jgi:hypothetical protein
VLRLYSTVHLYHAREPVQDTIQRLSSLPGVCHIPLHINPCTFLCKKMAERQDTQFQPNALFNCTGKVVGFLNHRLMVITPSTARDHVFIVVPDTWSSPERSNYAVPPSSNLTTPVKKPSTETLGRSQFISPSKPVPGRLTSPPSTTARKWMGLTATPDTYPSG